MVPYFAPAGTRLSLSDVCLGLGKGLLTDEPADELTERLVAFSGSSEGWLLSSGRAAMSLVLTAMRRAAAPHRREVVIPGYTCYSVPAAVERAGLEVRLCDVDPLTLSPDPDALSRFDFRNVLCIVTANLYGIPNALAPLEALARERGVYLLDDAAQALGAKWNSRPAGAFGHAGIYSFDKGKAITTIQGGALLVRDGAIAAQVNALLHGWPRPSARQSAIFAVQLAAYSLMLRPRCYDIVRRLPFLGLGRTPYETECSQRTYSKMLAGVAMRLVDRLDEINSVRVRNAELLRAALEDSPHLKLIRIPDEATCVYTRFPTLVRNAGARQKLIDRFDAAGIGATSSYPAALADVPELAERIRPEDREQPGAREIARSIVTLPTHAFTPVDVGSRVRRIVDATLSA